MDSIIIDRGSRLKRAWARNAARGTLPESTDLDAD